MRWRPLSVRVLGFTSTAYSFHGGPRHYEGHARRPTGAAGTARPPTAPTARSSIHMTTDHLVADATDGPRHVDGVVYGDRGACRAPLDPLHRRRRRLQTPPPARAARAASRVRGGGEHGGTKIGRVHYLVLLRCALTTALGEGLGYTAVVYLHLGGQSSSWGRTRRPTGAAARATTSTCTTSRAPGRHFRPLEPRSTSSWCRRLSRVPNATASGSRGRTEVARAATSTECGSTGPRHALRRPAALWCSRRFLGCRARNLCMVFELLFLYTHANKEYSWSAKMLLKHHHEHEIYIFRGVRHPQPFVARGRRDASTLVGA
jgi:hypothetical protein